MTRNHTIEVLAVALLACGPAATRAATITVTTSADTDIADAACSLREAFVAANVDFAYNGCTQGAGADRIVFAVALPATITVDSDLPTITSTLAIQGPGTELLTISGQDLHQLLVIDSPQDRWLGVEDLTLAHGFASFRGGGASITEGQTGHFRRVRFESNRSANGGGGLAVSGIQTRPSSATVEDCWFLDNIALGPTGGGGLLVADTTSTVHVDRTSFSANRADNEFGSAGAIVVIRSHLRLTRSTVSGNFANVRGGGLHAVGVTGPAHLEVEDTTITNNRSDADLNLTGNGGGISTNTSVDHPITLEFSNSILAANLSSGSPSYPDIYTPDAVTLISHGFNLVGDNSGTAVFTAGLPNANGDLVGTSGSPLDPELEPLLANGGFGPDHEPSAVVGSLVIDQGSCPGRGGDQRGYGDVLAQVRVVDLVAANAAGGDGCDIGSHERDGAPKADPNIFADGFESGHSLHWRGGP